jgi:hypothetical protein
MQKDFTQEQQEQAHNLGVKVSYLLEGNDPRVVGTALAELVIVWVSGYPGERREQVIEDWIKVVRAKVQAVKQADAANARGRT